MMACPLLDLFMHHGCDIAAVVAVVQWVVSEGWSPQKFPLSVRQLACLLRCSPPRARRLLQNLCRDGHLVKFDQPFGETTRYALNDRLCIAAEIFANCRGVIESSKGWSDNATRVYISKEQVKDQTLVLPSTTNNQLTRVAQTSQGLLDSTTPPGNSLDLLILCLPNEPWANTITHLRAQGTPKDALAAGIRCAIAEALTGCYVACPMAA